MTEEEYAFKWSKYHSQSLPHATSKTLSDVKE